VRVLGVDPGTRRCGWGVAERRGRAAVGVACGVLRMPDRAPLADRLELVYEGLGAQVDAFRPDVVAVEETFYAKYADAAIKLGHVRGVVLLLAAQRGLALAEYPAALVKRTVVGRGAADKTQVARMVARLLAMPEAETAGEDATDALAVAWTHLAAAR
jgi:crossover junction endodeoxyribonuclease RuvC